MRSTILFSAMTLCLGTITAYSVATGTGLDGWICRQLSVETELTDPVINITTHDFKPVQGAANADNVLSQVSYGMSREQVIAALGQPAAMDQTNNQWTYGDHIVLFNGDFAVGAITPDAKADARHRAAMYAAAADDDDARPVAKTNRAYRPNRLLHSIYTPARRPVRSSGNSSLVIDYTPGINGNLMFGSSYQKPEWLTAWSNHADRQRTTSPAVRQLNANRNGGMPYSSGYSR